MLPIGIVLQAYFGLPKSEFLIEKMSSIGKSNVANERLFGTLHIGWTKVKKLLFNIIWKYSIQSPGYNYDNWNHYATFDLLNGQLIQLN